MATAAENTEAEVRYRTVRKRISTLDHPTENWLLYRQPDPDDDDMLLLREDLDKRGLQDPLVVTEDGFVVSGNRRMMALRANGQQFARCRVIQGLYWFELSRDERLALLRKNNLQRSKSIEEQIRETMIDVSGAYEDLQDRRNRQVNGYREGQAAPLVIEGVKRRWGISPAKKDHWDRIKTIVDERRKYWPLSVRGVHYPLLNEAFFRNTRKNIVYRNDRQSYAATSDLITRMRLRGDLPWEAFADPTRPVEQFRAFHDVREFVRQEAERLFDGYWRDLLQTQPNYVECLVEKNTVYHMALQVTRKFQIPTISGRGFTSIDPWHELYQRYRASGKERLIVIVLSDFDPEGEMIPQVGGRTLRDDFGVDDFDIVKAGVSRQQVDRYQLAPQNFAKETSSNHDWFVERNGGENAVFELEALRPEDMLNDLESSITSVLDMELFNLEAQREKDEADYLKAARLEAKKALDGIGRKPVRTPPQT